MGVKDFIEECFTAPLQTFTLPAAFLHLFICVGTVRFGPLARLAAFCTFMVHSTSRVQCGSSTGWRALYFVMVNLVVRCPFSFSPQKERGVAPSWI